MLSSLVPRIACVRGHHFLAELLKPNVLVIDLGAHRGEFALQVVDRWGCKVLAVEPMANTLMRSVHHPNVQIVPVAVGGSSGRGLFHVCANPEASSLISKSSDRECTIEVETVTLQSLVERFRLKTVSLLKVDIEGAEIPLLRSVSDDLLKQIEQITVEFHEFSGACSREDIQQVTERLERLGFWALDFSRRKTDVLFVNIARHPLGAARRALLKYVLRNWLGGRRVLTRWIAARR